MPVPDYFMELLKELQATMHERRFRPDRRIGQNFTINHDIILKMVDAAEINEKDVVLEIGPGTGALTTELLHRCKVVAVELDHSLHGLLREKFGSEISSGRLILIHGDFLTEKLPAFNKVVSLPPYHISSALMSRLIISGFDIAVLVLQREFAQKLLSEPGFKDYGQLSVEITYGFSTEVIVQTISPQNFFPKPNTFSSMIKIVRKKPKLKVNDYALFREFLHQIFRLKNKNLSNAIQKTFPFQGKTKAGMEKIIARAARLDMKGVKVNLISAKEFAEIFNELTGKK